MLTPALIDQPWLVTNEVVQVVFNKRKIIKHDKPKFPSELPVRLPLYKNGIIQNSSSCPLPSLLTSFELLLAVLKYGKLGQPLLEL